MLWAVLPCSARCGHESGPALLSTLPLNSCNCKEASSWVLSCRSTQ